MRCFVGNCRDFDCGFGQCCYVGDQWNDRIKSGRAGDDTRICDLFDNADCTGNVFTVDRDGATDLTSSWWGNTWISGYRCYN